MAAVLLAFRLAGGYGSGELSIWGGPLARSQRSRRSNRNMNFARRRDCPAMRLSRLNYPGGGDRAVAVKLPAYATSACGCSIDR
jgi:hypothetical protein